MPAPTFILPQLLSLTPKPPAGERWIHEIKHDDFRTQLVVVHDGRARAFSRNGHDWTDRYPRLVAAALELCCRSAVIDGEAVVQIDVAKLVGVSVNTIRNMEASRTGPIAGRALNVQAVQAALEKSGIEFQNHGRPGVRLADKSAG